MHKPEPTIRAVFCPDLCAKWSGRREPTSIPRVHKEFSHFESVRLDQPFPEGLHSAGLADLRLADHYFERAVGHVHPILPHAHLVLANLLRGERDACCKIVKVKKNLNQDRKITKTGISLQLTTNVNEHLCVGIL